MKRILVADDSAFMRGLVKKELLSCGCEIVGEAENGLIALEKYKELNPDIVTLDITMGEMDGLETLKRIIEYDADANVLMVSAMGQKSVIQEAVQHGARGFLIKPFKKAMVASAIARISEKD